MTLEDEIIEAFKSGIAASKPFSFPNTEQWLKQWEKDHLIAEQQPNETNDP